MHDLKKLIAKYVGKQGAGVGKILNWLADYIVAPGFCMHVHYSHG
jgi:hypothetical protein